MKLCNFDTPTVSEVLDVLSVAAARRANPPIPRALVSAAPSPTEGLALLGAYTSIADPVVRQALLDLVSMLGGKTA